MTTKRAKRCVHCLQVQYLDESGACNRCQVEHNRPQFRQQTANTPRWRAPCYNCGRMRKFARDPALRRAPLICHLCRSMGTDTAERPVAPEATTAEPGSETKIRMMRWRAAKGYSIFHPNDAQHNSTPTV